MVEGENVLIGEVKDGQSFMGAVKQALMIDLLFTREELIKGSMKCTAKLCILQLCLISRSNRQTVWDAFVYAICTCNTCAICKYSAKYLSCQRNKPCPIHPSNIKRDIITH